jgi:hypothetical protein
MEMPRHIATLLAYPIKSELGGGFRGVYFIRSTKERKTSDRFETLEEARHWAKVQAHEAYDEIGYALAPVTRRGEYLANVWVA